MLQVISVVSTLCIALALGLYLTWETATPLISPTMRPAVAPQTSTATTDLLPVEGDRAKATEQQTDAVATLEQQVALLRREISSVQRQLQEQRQIATDGREEGEIETASRFDPAAMAEAARQRQEHLAEIEASFRHELIDQAWAFRATSAVQEAFTSEAAAPAVVHSLECRSHTCRAEISADDTGELGKTLPLLLQQLAPILPNVIANNVDEANGGGTILYLSENTNDPLQQGN